MQMYEKGEGKWGVFGFEDLVKEKSKCSTIFGANDPTTFFLSLLPFKNVSGYQITCWAGPTW